MTGDTTGTPPPAGTATPKGESDLEPVRKDVGFLSKIAVTLALVLGYLTIAIGSTNDEMLILPNRTLELPLFNASVPVHSFFLFAPLLLVALHGYFLLERHRLAIRLRDAWQPGFAKRVFIPAFLFRDPSLKSEKVLWPILFATSALTALLPLAVLLLMQWVYLPAREVSITRAHKGLVLIDLVLIAGAVLGTYLAVRKGSSKKQLWSRIGAVIVILMVTVPVTLMLFSVCKHPTKGGLQFHHHLDLSRWRPPDEGNRQGRLRPRLENLSYANLRGVDLSGADLSGFDLREADLTGASLRGTDLHDAQLDDAVLSNADFTGADLTGASLREAIAESSTFSGAILAHASLHELSGRRAVFFAADLRHAHLTAADLREADLRLVDLTGSWLRGTRLVEAELLGARVDSPAPLSFGADLRGADARWATGLPREWVDLRYADLRGAPLDGKNLQRLLLSGSRTGVVAADLAPDSELRRALSALRHEKRRFLAENMGSLQPKRYGELQTALDDVEVVEVATATSKPVPDFFRQQARYLVRASCSDEVFADALIDRAEGRIRPIDVASELELAAELLRVAAEEKRCPRLRQRLPELRRRLCARWKGEEALAELCRDER